jgi:hypothetical protein
MAIAQEMAREAHREFLEAKNVSDRAESLKRLAAAVDKMNEAAKLRKATIALQLSEIQAALKMFEEKLAPEPQKSNIVPTDRDD